MMKHRRTYIDAGTDTELIMLLPCIAVRPKPATVCFAWLFFYIQIGNLSRK